MCEAACFTAPGGSPSARRPAPASHLVEEPLAEVLHGALELVALGLPLLVVPHVLSCGALPCGGPGVVVHIVEPAAGVCAFLPAENIKLRVNTVTTSPLGSHREIGQAGKEDGEERSGVGSGPGAWLLQGGRAR